MYIIGLTTPVVLKDSTFLQLSPIRKKFYNQVLKLIKIHNVSPIPSNLMEIDDVSVILHFLSKTPYDLSVDLIHHCHIIAILCLLSSLLLVYIHVPTSLPIPFSSPISVFHPISAPLPFLLSSQSLSCACILLFKRISSSAMLREQDLSLANSNDNDPLLPITHFEH